MTEARRQWLLDNKKDTFSYENHVRVVVVTEEQVVVEVELTDKEKNIWNTPHGGIIFTAFDVACGTSSLAVSDAPAAMTVSSHVQFLHSSPDVKKMIVTAKVDRKTRSLAFCSAKVCDENGTLMATGETVMKYMKES